MHLWQPALKPPLTLSISGETAERLLAYVGESGRSNPEAVTRFVEDAITSRPLDLRLKDIRERFSDMTPREIEDLVDEAVAWARSPEGRACE